MLYWNSTHTTVTTEYTPSFSNRNDLKTFEQASAVAAALTANLGRTFLPTDAGGNCSPQFDVIEPPQVGDEVSEGFNGDYYPCGVVSRVGKDYRFIYVRDESGKERRAVRRRLTGSWKLGGFSLVKGRHERRNPSF